MIDDVYKANILEISEYSISFECDSDIDITGLEEDENRILSHVCMTPKFPGEYSEDEYIKDVLLMEPKSQVISGKIIIMNFDQKIEKELVENKKENTFVYVYKK